MDIGDPPATTGEILARLTREHGDNLSTTAVAAEALDLAHQALALASAARDAADYMRAARAPGTWRGYRSDWRQWAHWCETYHRTALPAAAGDVALFVSWQASRLVPSTIHRQLAALRAGHLEAGHPDPTTAPEVKAVLQGVRRTKTVAKRRKTPLVVSAMRQVLATLDDSGRGRRDRALLLVGWGAALRRSELVALDVEDLEIVPEGLVLTVRRSKTDQEGQGRVIGIPAHENTAYSASHAVLAWQEAAEIYSGPLFRAIDRYGYLHGRRLGDREVARLVKRVARAAGLAGDFSGHSLRAGFATAAAAAGASERAIANQTGHRNLSVLRGYIRPASIWLDNAAAIAAL